MYGCCAAAASAAVIAHTLLIEMTWLAIHMQSLKGDGIREDALGLGINDMHCESEGPVMIKSISIS